MLPVLLDAQRNGKLFLIFLADFAQERGISGSASELPRGELAGRLIFRNSAVTFLRELREARAVERVVVNALEMRLCRLISAASTTASSRRGGPIHVTTARTARGDDA